MKIFKEELTYMKPLPIGVDDFKKLIDKNYYYVDKTLLIKELLDKKCNEALKQINDKNI